MSNGYISCHLNIHIHQVITGCMGNGKGTNTISVDHLDRNPLNNCFDNLRIATREEQQKTWKNQTTKTQKRSVYARDAPGPRSSVRKLWVLSAFCDFQWLWGFDRSNV